MSMNKVGASESQMRLMQYIGAVIQQVTLTSPMSAEDVVAVLGICAGSAIANGKSVMSRREMRQMLMSNVDFAMQQADQMPAPSGLILPAGVA